MDRKITFALILLFAVYFSLRLTNLDTIEFGYDQPRLAYTIADFLKNGSYLTSQEFSLPSPWGNLSWGPSLVWIYSLFLNFSKNPVNASVIVAIFNFMSILGVFYLGNKFFSFRVGFISGLLLAVHPWWIIFSRMFYQPSIVPSLIVVSTLLLFFTIKKPRGWRISFLILSWGVLIQSYLIASSYVLISAIAVIVILWKKKIKFKDFYLPLSLGIVFNLIIFLPSFVFYVQNQDLFHKFFGSGKYSTSYFETLKNYLDFLYGWGLKWQLGYGYEDFIDSLPKVILVRPLIMVGFVFVFAYGVLKAFASKNIYSIILAFFSVAPLFAIPLIGVENVLPRYFLYVLPSMLLITALGLEDLSKRIKYFDFVFCAVFSVWSLVLISNYFGFVRDYSYPRGFLSHYSDIPYSFLDRSFKWIIDDAKNKNYGDITVSSDADLPKEVRLNWAQRYYWDYLFNKDGLDKVNNRIIGHYLMVFSPAEAEHSYRQFGPYVVYDAGEN